MSARSVKLALCTSARVSPGVISRATPALARRARRRAALPALGALGLVALACGAPGAADPAASEGGEELGQRGQSILGGETDREHTAVLAIATITADTESLCTGTLLAPNLVLTARHCVVPIENKLVSCSSSSFPSPYAPDSLWVSPSTSVLGADLFPVREIIVPDDDGALCGADIALLVLDGQFSDRLTPIAPRLDAPAERGEAFTAIGFGTALDEGGAGVRRAVSGLEVLCGAEQCEAPGVLTGTEFVGAQGVCEGDSGGPALDEEERVVGVASRTGQDCEFAIYSAVSAWGELIVAAAEHAAELGGYDTPEWALVAGFDEGATGDELDDVVNGDDTGGEVEVPALDGDGVASDPPAPSIEDMAGEQTRQSSSGSSGCSLGVPRHTSAGSLWLAALGLGLVGRLRRARPRPER